MLRILFIFSIFSTGASRRISRNKMQETFEKSHETFKKSQETFEKSHESFENYQEISPAENYVENLGEELYRSGRDSIGQNRLMNNLFNLRKGQSRSYREFDLMSVIASRVTRGQMTRDQRILLNQIMMAAKAKRSAKNAAYARPIIDFRRGFF